MVCHGRGDLSFYIHHGVFFGILTSGRQTQMRATTIQTIITSYNFQQGASASTGNTGNNAVP